MDKYQNIYDLAQDREITTHEIHQANDFYGHAAILKKYLGIPAGYQLKAAIEHGVYLKPEGWDVDWKSHLPSLFTFSSFRKRHLKKLTMKSLYVLGPYIYYAKPFLTAEESQTQLRRIGKNLLVFPAHSTHWVDVKYDIHNYCEILEKIGRDFDSVRICLYWKDVLRGAAEIYGQHNFECVTAGHIYDPQFLPRLKSIIESATITTSNQISTVIGYSITMGKPHFLMESEVYRTSKLKKFLDECVDVSINVDAEAIRRAFSTGLRSDITPDQVAVVEKYWGMGEEKTQDELKKILEESEALYRKNRNSPLINKKSDESIDSYEGSWGEILGKIACKLNNYPRRLPGELRINKTPIHYVDFHSFYHQANQIFRFELYGFHNKVDKLFILDCGAHIGLASIYFANQFPGAKIMAFEADPSIAKVLRKNINSFGCNNITTYPQAVWINNDGVLFSSSRDDSGYISEHKSENCIKVPTIRLRDILKDNKVDLLKLDIEGAEYEVLKDCDEYLKNVDCIIVELHKFKKEKLSIGNLLCILEKNNFEYALSDLHPADWLETSQKPPFKALMTGKFIITVYAWRVVNGFEAVKKSNAAERKCSPGEVNWLSTDRQANIAHKYRDIHLICQVSDHQKTGGAAIAGHRLFTGLKSAHANIKLITFNDPTVSENHCYSWVQGLDNNRAISNTKTAVSNSLTSNDWVDLVSAALDMATPQIINIHNIHEAIHYHRVPFDVLDVMASKARLVFTLHDMWLLTGRCAYTGNCQRFIDHSCNETCPTPTIYPQARPNEISALLRAKIDFFQRNPGAVIVTPSQWLANQVKKSFLKDHRIEVIPYGIDTTVFRPDHDREGLRRSIGIPRNACVLLISAANLSDHRKGARLFLKALSKIKMNLIVLTVGKTNIKPELPKNIKFYNYGFVTSPEEMAFAYSVADLFICPSLEDNLPCVLIESISCGTPCIGFNVGGVPEVIRQGKTGWLATETTSKSLSGLIAKLIKSPEKLSVLRTSCRAVANKEYALNVQTERYLKLYLELVGQEADIFTLANCKQKDRENNLESEYEVIQKYIGNGEINAAKVRLETLVDTYPGFAIGHNDLGVLAYKEGLRKEALKHYEAAVKLQPENIVFLKNLADYYYVELGQIEEAMKFYVKVLQIEPKDIETLMVVGHLCIAIEKYSEAKNFYEKILEIDSDNEEARDFIENLNSKCRKIVQKLNDEEKPLVNDLKNLNDIDSDKYLVSAIVSTYNAEKFIRGCLDDLENQTIADRLEIIVVNSGSTESEEAIVREFQTKYENITYIRSDKRETVYAAWNRGIKAATGKYITNANTDDRHRNDAYEIMVQTLENNSNVSLVYADVIITEKQNETFDCCSPVGYYRWLDWNRDDLLNKGCFMGPQPMWRRNIHKEYGFFDESFVTSGDYEFWMRISQTNDFLHIPETLGLYLKSTSSIEHTNRRNQAVENERILRMYKNAQHTGKVIRKNWCNNKSTRHIYNDPLRKNRQLHLPESLYREIISEFSIDKPEITIKKLEKLSNDFPDFAIVHNDLGVLYYKNYYNDRVLAHYQKAVELEPENINFRKNLADFLYVEESRVEDALENYVEVLRIKPDDVETLLITGHICTALERFEDAMSFYHKVLEIEPENLDTLQKLEALEKRQISMPKQETRGEEKAAGKTEIIQAESHTTSDDIPIIQASIVEDFIKKADALFQQERIDQAVDTLLKTIAMDSNDGRLYLILARHLINHNRHQQALEVLSEMSLKLPQDLAREKMLTEGYSHEGLGNFQAAEESINEDLEWTNENPYALNLKGILAYRNGDKETAEQHFKRAIEFNSEYGEPHTNLGALVWEKGDPKKALEYYERGFSVSPTDIDVANAYHEAVAVTGEYLRGEKVAGKALKKYPLCRKIRYLLIDILIKQGKSEKALGELETAISILGIDEGLLDTAIGYRKQVENNKYYGSSKKPNVSLCMIVKDEEDNLATCLASVKPIVDEIVIVDTGSIDRTKTIAEFFGAHVFDFKWNGDFSAARNFSLSKAKGRWILIMDADEVISSKDYGRFRKLVSRKAKGPAAYSVVTRNYCFKANSLGWTKNDGTYADAEAGSGWLPSEKVRLFRGDKKICFEGAIHEMVDPVLKRVDIAIEKCLIPVHHYGPLNPEKLDAKGLIYYEIGRKKLVEKGDDMGAVRELAIQATILERNTEALELWQQLVSMKPGDFEVAKAFINIGTIKIRMKDYGGALAAAKKAVKFGPSLKESNYNLALAELYSGNALRSIGVIESCKEIFQNYPPALFILAAARCCSGDDVNGIKELQKLKSMSIGSMITYSCAELAEGLISAGELQLALRLLRATIESGLFSKNILDLYSVGLSQKEINKDLGKPSYTKIDMSELHAVSNI